MTYRTMLVEMNSGGRVEKRARLAHDLATRFGATLIGMHVSPSPMQDFLVWGGEGAYVPAEAIEAMRGTYDAAKRRMRAAFERIQTMGGATTVWREAEGMPAPTLTSAAHLADLVIAGTEADDTVTRLEVIDELVLGAGVPVLVLPPADGLDVIGRRVLVAWNGRREATRAVHDALPILAKAEDVILSAVGDEAAASLEQASQLLLRHGIRTRHESIDAPDSAAGEVLLGRAREHGVDLVVMGAYGHTRLREMVFGGATRHALRHATLPLLFGG